MKEFNVLRDSVGDFQNILFGAHILVGENSDRRAQKVNIADILYVFMDYYINDRASGWYTDPEVKIVLCTLPEEIQRNMLSDLGGSTAAFFYDLPVPDYCKGVTGEKMKYLNIPFDESMDKFLDEMNNCCYDLPVSSTAFYNTIIENLSNYPIVSDYLRNFGMVDDDARYDRPVKEDEKKDDDDILSNILNRLSDVEDSFVNGSGFPDPPNPMGGNDPDKLKKIEKDFEMYGDQSSMGLSGKAFDPNSNTPILDQFSFEMTRAAKEGKYDPVIGRDDIVDSMIEDMCKRKKANVILLGDAGVGKSAIVEHLAQRIVDGNVPSQLRGKRIYSLNLNDLVAGTKYRGEYEARLQGIIKEVIGDPNIIIYIDEFHNLVGNGGERGNGDGANILKPYLARGEFRCIGSTTAEEYRKFIEKDAALKRRFTEIYVQEPSIEETIKILRAIGPKYEEFHRVKCPLDVIKACVEWSGRYITDRFFPDKAIDVLDKACSYVKISQVQDMEVQNQLTEELDRIIDEKIYAVVVERDFTRGEELRLKEAELEAKLDKELRTRDKEAKKRKNWPTLTLEDIARAVSKLSKVPVDKISETDNEMLRNMKLILEKRVIGQDEAIKAIVQALQRNYLGLRDPGKPVMSSLFIGPSGVGKTLICKEVAKIFFGSEKALIRIDMNNFKTEMDVTRLIGASAGYVGYEDEPLLLRVKRQPRSIVLLDEIEKAHPSIYDIFMDILDEGVCTLANGTRVDFTNTIIIFTGNIGTRELKDTRSLGFESALEVDRAKRNQSIVQKAVEKTFRPEFLNRLSSVVVFNELGTQELGKIFNMNLQDIKKKLGHGKYVVQVGKALRDYIISLCNPIYGARDLARNIEKYVVDPISEAMLEDTEKTKFSVDLGDNKESIVK